MNDLSWWVYLADVFDSAGGFMIFLTVVTGIIAIVSIVLYIIALYDNTEALAASRMEFMRLTGRAWKLALTGFFLFSILVLLMPDKQTMYLILASEMGETIITNPESQEIFRDMKAYIKDNLQKEFVPNNNGNGR